nr:TPA_asm: m109 ORF [Murid betaherpesvirus 1]DBA08070.1 TPA_asm: m109 ORF [Murid betaherpesvirus 1]
MKGTVGEFESLTSVVIVRFGRVFIAATFFRRIEAAATGAADGARATHRSGRLHGGGHRGVADALGDIVGFGAVGARRVFDQDDLQQAAVRHQSQEAGARAVGPRRRRDRRDGLVTDDAPAVEHVHDLLRSVVRGDVQRHASLGRRSGRRAAVRRLHDGRAQPAGPPVLGAALAVRAVQNAGALVGPLTEVEHAGDILMQRPTRVPEGEVTSSRNDGRSASIWRGHGPNEGLFTGRDEKSGHVIYRDAGTISIWSAKCEDRRRNEPRIRSGLRFIKSASRPFLIYA